MSFKSFTDNGFTEAAEKSILQQIENRDIVKTLKSDEDIAAFVSTLINRTD